MSNGEGRQERWDKASNYPIKDGWNVRVTLVYVDDYGVGQLNGTDVINLTHDEKEKAVDLKSLLKAGNNYLRVVAVNLHPPVWSLHYKIGVFNEKGEPQYDAIDLNVKGETPHQGVQYDVIYSFPKS